MRVEAFLAQRLDHAAAGRQADFALGGTPAHQNGDLASGSLRHGTPTRLISHSSAMPDFSFTRRAHFLAQRLEVGGGGIAGIDQEIAVLLADLRRADASGRGNRLRRSVARPCGRADS